MNILIIEDEQELADSMVRYLQKNAYHCETALHFTQAMEKINLFVTITGKNSLHLSNSAIKEFNQLNKTLNALTQKL